MRSFIYGVLAFAIMLGTYFLVVGFVSDPSFAKEQFAKYWYFILSLAAGFGIQVGLFVYFKSIIDKAKIDGRVLGVTGGTSATTMISCCTHYLSNFVPVIGTTGLVAFVGQYQTDLFLFGILLNFGGIIYIASKIFKFRKI